MGNAECCFGDSGFVERPLTMERLEYAVRTMDPKEVKQCLEAGMPVNAPINRQGHTVMDVFLMEQKHMMDQCTKSTRGRPQDVTQVMYHMQDSANEVMNILKSYGATMSSSKAALRRD